MIGYIIEPNGRIDGSFFGAVHHFKEAIGDNTVVYVETELPLRNPHDVIYYDFDVKNFVYCPKENAQTTFDYSKKLWVDMRELSEVQAQKWAEIKQLRDELEMGGFEYDGKVYDSNQNAQSRIVTAEAMNIAVEWTLKDNSTVWLEPEQLTELRQALAIHVTTIHARGKVAREKIYSATTIEAIESVLF